MIFFLLSILFFLSILEVKTSDGIKIQLDKKYAHKSILLSNLESIKYVGPIEICVDSKTLSTIYDFMQRDSHVLKKDYNPLEINFSNETLEYFGKMNNAELIEICNGANYLEYPYLLEVTSKVLAIRLSQNTLRKKNEILGDKRISEEEMDYIIQDYNWFNENM